MIDIEDLKFSYPSQANDTLNGLTFDIKQGEIFGFLGPSGSGKSTTQKLLIGLLKGHRGSAKIFGKEVDQWDSSI